MIYFKHTLQGMKARLMSLRTTLTSFAFPKIRFAQIRLYMMDWRHE